MAENEFISGDQAPRRLNLRLRHLNRTLLALAAPAIIEYFLFSMVFFVDTLIVGWLRNEAFLAAAALSRMAMFFINAPYIALSISAASIVSRAWGERDRRTACRYTALSLLIAFSTAAGIATLGILCSHGIIKLLGGSPEVVRLGSGYLKILLLSCIFGQIIFTSNGIHRSKGDTMRAMWISILMNLINVFASIMLAFGIGAPRLGFYGVAWGTVIARTTGSLVSISWLFSARGIGLRPHHFLSISKVMLSRLWYLTAPALAERVANTGAYLVFMRVVAAMGTTILAAHQLTLQMESFCYMPAWGLAIAASTIVGQAIGAELEHIAEIAVRRLLITAGLSMGLLSILFALTGSHLVRVFGATPDVLTLSGLALRISALELPFLAFTFVFIGALRGAGDTKTPLFVGLFCTLLIRLPAVWLLSFVMGLGLAGVWLATAADWFIRTFALLYFFRKGVWKKLHQREKQRFQE